MIARILICKICGEPRRAKCRKPDEVANSAVLSKPIRNPYQARAIKKNMTTANTPQNAAAKRVIITWWCPMIAARSRINLYGAFRGSWSRLRHDCALAIVWLSKGA
jgi:hypothetical protein